uniref:Uncharacterized protein n=1 Tax=Ascaris lumbricoides TaxID=6252 RepID=A0A0M3HZG0_ASCLU
MCGRTSEQSLNKCYQCKKHTKTLHSPATQQGHSLQRQEPFVSDFRFRRIYGNEIALLARNCNESFRNTERVDRTRASEENMQESRSIHRKRKSFFACFSHHLEKILGFFEHPRLENGIEMEEPLLQRVVTSIEKRSAAIKL